MLKDNDQVRELQRIFARQYMCLEQLRIQLGDLASATYAANEAAKFIGRRAPLHSRARSKKGSVAPPSGTLTKIPGFTRRAEEPRTEGFQTASAARDSYLLDGFLRFVIAKALPRCVGLSPREIPCTRQTQGRGGAPQAALSWVRVCARIDFREGAELRVRTEDQVDTRARPLDRVRLPVVPLVLAFGAGDGCH
jgi:hypothetical protein